MYHSDSRKDWIKSSRQNQPTVLLNARLPPPPAILYYMHPSSGSKLRSGPALKSTTSPSTHLLMETCQAGQHLLRVCIRVRH